MKRELCCAFFSISMVMLCSGCWSRVEPKNVSLLNSILFGINEDGNYQLTKEIMKLSAEIGGKGDKILLFRLYVREKQ
jgi:hypothetical protein